MYYGSPEGSEGRLRSWLSDASLTMKSEPGLSWDEMAPPYVASLYWTYTTITTVGYGDLTPTATGECPHVVQPSLPLLLPHSRLSSTRFFTQVTLHSSLTPPQASGCTPRSL